MHSVEHGESAEGSVLTVNESLTDDAIRDEQLAMESSQLSPPFPVPLHQLTLYSVPAGKTVAGSPLPRFATL